MTRRFFVFLILQFAFVISYAQTSSPKVKGWHLLSHDQGYLGIGLQEAYALVKNKKSKTVLIAVIDSGVDTTHEDLRQVLWVNPKEIPGNGIDDDGNGYRDDIHGWNFDGASNGENLTSNSHEITRVYHNWKSEFEGKKEKDISANRKFMYSQWKISEQMLKKQYAEYEKNIGSIQQTSDILQLTNNLITRHLRKPDYTRNEIALLSGKDSLGWAASIWNSMFSRSTDATTKNTEILEQVEAYKNVLLNNKKRWEESPQDLRGKLTKDKYEDINDRFYGNNNLQTGSGNHGTHVAGIIGAIRNNNKGVDGIVENSRIMVLRAVPGGDEHDKDVALAIRYAVDNGAEIINMSFGKPVSPYKHFVDDAIRYAASKNVLLVHGAGNDAVDLDEKIFYPNPIFLNGELADNMLTVGASGDVSTGKLVADFSNYSDKVVDIFAPGVYINSTVTGNGYEPYDGTSMASPVAAGVAGLIKSYFPQLTPPQIIELILRTGTEIKTEVNVPGEKNKMASLKKLSKSGKIINAYAAMKLAIQLYGTSNTSTSN